MPSPAAGPPADPGEKDSDRPDAETLLKMARSFEVRPEHSRRPFGDVGRITVEWRGKIPEDDEAWRVSDGSATLPHDSHRAHDLRPSARDEACLAHTRQPSALEAITFVQTFLTANPTGRLPEERSEAGATDAGRATGDGRALPAAHRLRTPVKIGGGRRESGRGSGPQALQPA
jgi:hypothetical protein